MDEAAGWLRRTTREGWGCGPAPHPLAVCSKINPTCTLKYVAVKPITRILVVKFNGRHSERACCPLT